MENVYGEIVISAPTTCKRFIGKNCIVTAGTKGIGLAIAIRLAQEGGNVIICSRKEKNVLEAIERAKQERNVELQGTTCNVSNDQELKAFVEFCLLKFNNQIDVIVSNVGMNPYAGSTFQMEEKTYDKIMSSNVKTHWQLLKLCDDYLVKGSAVVLISSVAAHAPSFPLSIYGVSKTALVSLGKALSSEYGPRGIRINSICPGVVRTKLSEMLWKNDPDAKQKPTHLRRYADPIEMAGLAAFLTSFEASYLTGESIVIDGGSDAKL